MNHLNSWSSTKEKTSDLLLFPLIWQPNLYSLKQQRFHAYFIKSPHIAVPLYKTLVHLMLWKVLTPRSTTNAASRKRSLTVLLQLIRNDGFGVISHSLNILLFCKKKMFLYARKSVLFIQNKISISKTKRKTAVYFYTLVCPSQCHSIIAEVVLSAGVNYAESLSHTVWAKLPLLTFISFMIFCRQTKHSTS